MLLKLSKNIVLNIVIIAPKNYSLRKLNMFHIFQWTVNGDPMVIGHHVQSLAEGERRRDQEQWLHQHQMEVTHAKEKQRRHLLVIQKLVLLTVSGDLMAIGHHAQKHAEGGRRRVQEQRADRQHMEVKYVKEKQRRHLIAIQMPVQLTVNGDPMAIGHHARNLAEEEKRLGQEQSLDQQQMEVNCVKVKQ